MIVHAIIFILLAGVGTWVFLNSRKKARLIKGAAAWPVVPGKITAATIRRYESTDSDGTSTSFEPQVAYAYDYQGQSRTGSRLFVGDAKTYSTQGGAQKAIAAYPVGGAVSVHVDPANPDNAALTVGGATNLSGAIIFWVLAVVSLFLGGH